jgi:outer membrane protein TolC
MNMLFGLVFSLSTNSWAEPDELVFGILRDGPSLVEEERVQSYIIALQELRNSLGPEVEIRIPVEHMQPPRYSGDEDPLVEQRKKLESLLAVKEIDYIIAAGPIGAKIASDYGLSRKGLNKPVFAPMVYEAALQGLSPDEKTNASDINNFHFIDIPYSFENDLTAFSEIISFSDLAIVVDERVAGMLGKTFKEKLFRRISGVQNIEILSVGDTAAPLISKLASLPETIEAIYITETYSMGDAQRSILIKNLNNLKKPTFSRSGIEDVEKGVFGGLMHQDIENLRISFLQDSILSHYEDEIPLKNLPVYLNVYGNLMLNVRTSAEIGVALSWDVLAEAKQIDGRTGYGRFGVTESAEKFSLQSVLNVPSDHPLLRAEKDKISYIEFEVGKNAATSLPQLQLTAGGSINDIDRADQSLNLIPWYNVNTGLQLNQTLFSPSDRSAVRLAEEGVQLTKVDVERRRENLRADFAKTYIQLCNAFAEENASRDILGRVRNVYDIAKRRSVKDSDLQADVLHLEAELYQYKRLVLDAQANTRQMEIALNKVMWRSLELSVRISEIDTNVEVPSKESLLMRYMTDPKSFPIFTKIMLERGKAENYDLNIQKSKQAYKKIELEEAKNTRFDPKIAAYGGIRWNFLQPNDERFESEIFKGLINQRDNLDWTAGVNVQVPIFDGFYKHNEISQKFAEVAKENHLLEEAERRLEANVRQSLIELNTKYRSIAFNRISQDRSHDSFLETLKLYEEGKAQLNTVIAIHRLSNDSYFEHISSLFSFRYAFVSLMGELGLLDYYSNENISKGLFDELNEVYRQNGFDIPSLNR